MTNQELRRYINLAEGMFSEGEREVSDTVLRLLDEHARMKLALESISYCSPSGATGHAILARRVLESLEGDYS